jgi:hypothetical protein
MPDLQTEMQKILQSWEQPESTEETTVFTTTTNTSRATFEIVRDDPGLPKAQYIRKLEVMGHKKASTSSLLSQMVRQGHIWVDSSGCLRPNHTEYRSLKASKVSPKKLKQGKTSKLRTSEAAEAPTPLGETKRVLPTIVFRSKIDEILDGISLSDAHALYRQLHTYFGGLPK